MNSWIEQRAADGHASAAWLAQPARAPVGAVVVVQEIFGVNAHIRGVANALAEQGYLAIAPAVFDRIEPDVQLGYGAQGVERGVALMRGASLEHALLDIDAARAAVARPGLGVAVLGFCWGGLLAWLSATRLDGLAAAVPYYPGGIGGFLAETPRCPVLAHFAERDDHIPVADAQALQSRYPGRATVHLYPADHGFNCDERPSYDAAAAALAWQRTLAFLARHMGANLGAAAPQAEAR